MTVPPRKLYISAGEPSGDAHGAALVGALRTAGPTLELEAMGGAALAAAGARIVEPADGLAAFGLVEAATALPAHLGALWRVRRRLSRGPYAAAALIDYPGFHLRVAAAAARYRIPVLYYIPPQLWAWSPGRARLLRQSVSLVASVLPFEPRFLRTLGVRATFVGHPVMDAVRPSRAEARQRLGIDPDRPVLGLLPGSRPTEIRRHWPLFRQTAHLIRLRRPEVVTVLGAVPGQDYRLDGEPLVAAAAELALAASDAALVKSGSATLEAAAGGTPLVIAYQLHPWTYAVARRVVTIPFVGLPNLIAGRQVVPEFLQRDATTERLIAALEPLLDGTSTAVRRQRAGLAEVVERMGPPGAADRVAALLQELAA